MTSQPELFPSGTGKAAHAYALDALALSAMRGLSLGVYWRENDWLFTLAFVPEQRAMEIAG